MPLIQQWLDWSDTDICLCWFRPVLLALQLLKPNSHVAIQGEDENLLKAHDEKWLAALSVCSGFGLILLKPGPIHLPAVVSVGLCNNSPLKKRKMAIKGKSIHPNGVTQVPPHFIRKMHSDEVECARVKFWNACYTSLGLFTFSIK